MTGLGITVLLQTLLITGGAGSYAEVPCVEVSYAEVHRMAQRTGQPILVLVASPSSPGYHELRQSVAQQLQRRGLVKRVGFAIVNRDQQGRLSQLLIGRGPAPQLLMFRKTSRGWKRRKLIGSQDEKKVDDFICEAVALDNIARATSRNLASRRRPAQGEKRLNSSTP